MARIKICNKTEEERNVKRLCCRSPKQEREILNDGLFNLYKKELDSKKDKSDTPQDESNTENKFKEKFKSTSETPKELDKKRKSFAVTPKLSTVNFDNIGGMDDVLEKVISMFRHYEVLDLSKKCDALGLGILLHGLPGCGKTFLAHALAGEIGIPIIEVSSTELVCGISGESERKIREVFAGALATGRCILFIDEIEAICPKREKSENAMLTRMTTQMIKCFDELNQKDPDRNVVVIGATNFPDSLDNALRRGGRFTYEIAIEMPNEDARLNILQVVCNNMLSDLDFRWLARHTPGYAGADLKALSSIAKMKTLNRIVPLKSLQQRKIENKPSGAGRWFTKWFQTIDCPEVEKCCILNDFKTALKEFVPSSKREGFISVADTTWDEIGSYEDIKDELQQTIMMRVENHKSFKDIKKKGVLLYGPKGCGKTLLAKALANEHSLNFLVVNGPELLSMYLGESENNIRKCFKKAEYAAPCIIFFDEFDGLCPSRASSNHNAAMGSVVNQLLAVAAGASKEKQIFLFAATNRLDKIDSAMLRPGRFDKVLYVGLPSPDGRVKILKSLLKQKTVEEGFDLEKIALDPRCEHFSGADLSYLVDEALTKVLIERKKLGLKPEGKLVLCMRHFEEALRKIKPSVSKEERSFYEERNAELSSRFK